MKKILDNRGFETLLETEVDEFGEVLARPYIELAKEGISEEMKEIRALENPPKRGDDYWN